MPRECRRELTGATPRLRDIAQQVRDVDGERLDRRRRPARGHVGHPGLAQHDLMREIPTEQVPPVEEHDAQLDVGLDQRAHLAPFRAHQFVILQLEPDGSGAMRLGEARHRRRRGPETLRLQRIAIHGRQAGQRSIHADHAVAPHFAVH